MKRNPQTKMAAFMKRTEAIAGQASKDGPEAEVLLAAIRRAFLTKAPDIYNEKGGPLAGGLHCVNLFATSLCLEDEGGRLCTQTPTVIERVQECHSPEDALVFFATAARAFEAIVDAANAELDKAERIIAAMHREARRAA
jgi:hypothetical protein